ncbi:MAG: SDR family oxidoreductase [Candidatus Omnitrophica bacterium]|nr:SDR family oxidoreductase [Candidatus Omnitrophota bacterium]
MAYRYLITGGAGFIGSNIAEELLARGEYVRILDNLSTGSEENISEFKNNVDFIHGDIRNTEDVKRAVKDIDFVIHQAALGSVARSLEAPMETNDVNVNGTLNMLINARDAGVKRFIYASSSSVYGNCKEFPQDESFKPGPISPYAVSKLTGECYCRVFNETMGLETVVLRYFNVFGPRQNPRSKYSAVIPIFIRNLMKDQPCIINGDGAQSRDFTFVSNVTDANIAACTARSAVGKVINVARGENHSVQDVAEGIKKILNKNIDSVYGPDRAGDIKRSIANVKELKEVLKIETGVTFNAGLKKTVDWFLKSGS